MSQLASQPGDLEKGNIRDNGLDPQSTPDQPSQEESAFDDSSGPLFSMYSKVIEEEDDKMAKTLQKDSDGILIFTGLFSASVAALLSVTIQDLRPNSQDTSAFYLRNIYGALADPNVTQPSSPSHIAIPPPFSPPKYAIWVNSMWFLSFVLSLICALVAMSVQQWVRRYIVVTQPSRCGPEKRARIRAIFFDDMNESIPCAAIDILPTLLHLSLLLFFGGLGIFLFNVNHAVFWSGLTLGFLYFSLCGILVLLKPTTILLVLGGMIFVRVGLDQLASKRSWKYDLQIVKWLIRAFRSEEALEKFFDAIPGFFNSNMVNLREKDFKHFLAKYWNVLNRFLCQSLSSSLVAESDKYLRLNTCLKAMNAIYRSYNLSIPCDIFVKSRDKVPQFAEIVPGQLLAYCTSEHKHTAHYAQCMVARILASVPERDDRWIQFATSAFGLPISDLRDYIDHGNDSVSLAVLIYLIRQSNDYRFCDQDALKTFSKLDIHQTLPGLQHDFCTLWNEIAQEARNGKSEIPVKILREIRHLYISLHRGTGAAPTAFSASTLSLYRFPVPVYYILPDIPNNILLRPSSYPLCDIASHRPDSSTHLHITNSHASAQPGHSSDASPQHFTSDGNTVSRQVKEATLTAAPAFSSDPTTPSEVGNSSQVPTATLLVLPAHTSACPTNASPSGAVSTALQDIPQTAKSPHPLERTKQRDILTPFAEPDISGILFSASSTPALAPEPASTPPLQKSSLASPEAGATSASNPLLPASSVAGYSILTSPPLFRAPILLNAELLALLGSTTSSRPLDDASMPLLRARGLVNPGSMCFVNAVLHLLVHSPPFWNLLRELGDLKGLRGSGGPETGAGATPVADATVRFFEEFAFKEPPQQATSGPRGPDEAKKEHNAVDSFEPTYMYDAMKDKRQLRNLLDGQQQDAEEFFRLYLDALDEDLLVLLSSINTHKPASGAPEVREREVPRLGPTEMGKRGSTASVYGSPITRIFGVKSCSRVRATNQLDAVTVEDWRSLQLDIRSDSVHTVQDALAFLAQPQPVQVGQPSSSGPSRQLLLDSESLPPVLVLHLKRFLYDAVSDGINKISKPVQFAPELEIPLGIMTPVAGKSVEPVDYKLYGVLYHHGESVGSGHYTVDVLHWNGDGGGKEGWLHIDDEAAIAVQHEEMFGNRDDKRGDDRCAYMLFYCRTTPTQHGKPYT